MAIRDTLEVYIDGSLDNSRNGSWAVAAFMNDKLIFESSGFTKTDSTDANRTETLAFIDAVSHVAMILPSFVNEAIFYSDSKALVDAYNRFTNLGDKNNDLAHLLDDIRDDYPGLILRWVKGHSGNKWNNLVDRLAKRARIERKGHFKIRDWEQPAKAKAKIKNENPREKAKH